MTKVMEGTVRDLVGTLTIEEKGGPGSGHKGHSGRPGKRGGSSPGTSSRAGNLSDLSSDSQAKILDAEKIIRAIDNDERMRNITLGLMQDGTFPDTMNVTASIDGSEAAGNGWIDMDNEESFTITVADHPEYINSDVISTLGGLESDARKAQKTGWNVNTSTPKERADWEQRHYGRTFGGDFDHAETWGLLELERFMEGVTGKKSDMIDTFAEQLEGFKSVHFSISLKGGPGSGHRGHRGIPGKRGGSLPGSGFSPGTAPTQRTSVDVPSKGASDFLSEGIRSTSRAYESWDQPSPGERERVKSEIVTELAQRSGLTEDEVNSALSTWAHSSNDEDMRSLSLQEAVSEEFGLKMSDWQQGNIERLRTEIQEGYAKSPLAKATAAIDPNYTADLWAADVKGEGFTSLFSRDKERALVRSMYDYTQDELRKSGYGPNDTIQLFRGVSHGDTDPGFRTGKTYSYVGNAMESWSISKDVATGFQEGRDLYASTTAMSVPVRNILGTAKTGFGCLTEGEFVIFGTIPGSSVLMESVTFEDLYSEEGWVTI